MILTSTSSGLRGRKRLFSSLVARGISEHNRIYSDSITIHCINISNSEAVVTTITDMKLLRNSESSVGAWDNLEVISLRFRALVDSDLSIVSLYPKIAPNGVFAQARQLNIEVIT